MGSPRVKAKIKVKAQVLLVHNDKVLVYRVRDEKTNTHIYRLVGGKVEYGELSEKAAVREFFEETTLIVQNPKLLGSFESLYSLHGKVKHEFIQVYQCVFEDQKNYLREKIKLFEPGEILNDAEWVDRNFLCQKSTPFYPEHLKNILLEKSFV